MNEVMTEIRLYGVLGKTFGKIHHRLITNKNEAARALAATVDGFEKFMLSSKKRGLTFAVFSGDRNITLEDLDYPSTGEVIKILPVIIGSKQSGLLQTILGAVLVVAGVVITGLSYGWAAPVGGAMISTGAAMMVGGVIQLLSPQTAGLASKQDSANKASYAFGSPTNTASQGYPVGLLYGQRRIGGAIISAGIYVEDQQ